LSQYRKAGLHWAFDSLPDLAISAVAKIKKFAARVQTEGAELMRDDAGRL
jgi:hypothetical protein